MSDVKMVALSAATTMFAILLIDEYGPFPFAFVYLPLTCFVIGLVFWSVSLYRLIRHRDMVKKMFVSGCLFLLYPFLIEIILICGFIMA